MRFMLTFFADDAAWMALTEAEREEAIARIGAWYAEHARAGRIVEGHRLAPKTSARTVRLGPAGRGGAPLVTDGPFTETKEVIGSYAIIEVAGPDEALAVAQAWPAGGAVEVRPVMDE
ncbi:MAG TPA: YciI family protein [Ktedonobacterales bacterium]|jgi:hypothetical protein